MRVHSSRKIEDLKRLRKTGFSINELVKELKIPKTTIWHHVHTLKLPRKAVISIKSKQGGSHKRKLENIIKAKEVANTILLGKDRELSIIFSMLYWAEGSKGDCEFINSDGRMIKLYLNIIQKIFHIKTNEIKPTLRIFSGMNKKKCLLYWSSITNIPQKEFIIRINDGGIRSNTKYGMCRITIKKGHFVLKVFNALIDQVCKELL
ncbi:MAG TPA: hypothetical protein VIH31_02805 [Candidatus Paceibacterota bacterium]